MTGKIKATPANLVMGFLGVGKTTAILELLKHKPADQTWAVLVNEFGRIGIDGSIYAAHNAVVREVPGGCLCCAAGLPFEVAVNRLLAEAKPDRLLIEPTGLGHPKKVLDKLTGGYFSRVLDVRAAICLVDPRKFKDARYTGNENFIDQIALSDVLVANKMDLADAESVALFNDCAINSDPPKALSAQTVQGHLDCGWLDLPRNPARLATHPDAHTSASIGLRTDRVHKAGLESAGLDYQSSGAVFPPGSRFDYRRLYRLLARPDIERIKAVVATDQGWFVFNAGDGLLTALQIRPGESSRIEMLSRSGNPEVLLAAINRCLLPDDHGPE